MIKSIFSLEDGRLHRLPNSLPAGWKLVALLSVLLLLLQVCGQAQSGGARPVTGKAFDASGAGLPGVTIVVKGSTNGAATDAAGNFSIQADNDVLVFSFIGFVAQEVAVGNKTQVNLRYALFFSSARPAGIPCKQVNASRFCFSDHPVLNLIFN